MAEDAQASVRITCTVEFALGLLALAPSEKCRTDRYRPCVMRTAVYGSQAITTPQHSSMRSTFAFRGHFDLPRGMTDAQMLLPSVFGPSGHP